MSIHNLQRTAFAADIARRVAADGASARPTPLRALLVLGSVASVAVAALLADPSAALRADPELATLLRGMAAIKALLCVGGLGALWWRFGHAVTPRIALAYLVGAWLTAGASMLIWQLSSIPLAALAFHVGAFALLVAAWRDGARSRRAPTSA